MYSSQSSPSRDSSRSASSVAQLDTSGSSSSSSAGSSTSGSETDTHCPVDFRMMFKRLSLKFSVGLSEPSEPDSVLNSRLSVKTLKYLFKLLSLYKLDIYLTDLCEAGFYTTFSLHELTTNDLDRLHVSPYDKKKFLKLQLFIRQVMSTIKIQPATKTHQEVNATKPKFTNTKTTNPTTQTKVPASSRQPLNKSKPLSARQPLKNKPEPKKTNHDSEIKDTVAVHHSGSVKPSQRTGGFGPQSTIASVQQVVSSAYNYGVPKSVKTRRPMNNVRTAPSASRVVPAADIYVFARKRPKLTCENGFEDVVVVPPMQQDGQAVICVEEAKSALDGAALIRKNEFTFDKVFDSTLSNNQLFDINIRPFLTNRTDFSCICFGQTGSGKTHTLFGSRQQDGLCVLTAEALFARNERLYCGFYEIYNGQLYDLQNSKSRLVLRNDSQGQMHVVGLVETEVKSLTQLRRTLETAQANRHIGVTSFNKASSRSHAIVQLTMPAQPTVANSGQVIFKVKSKVNSGLNREVGPRALRVLFIDLAGSERGIDAQHNRSDNRKEGAEINQSLLALKECIRCMDQSCAHAPFRQSKLTRVLRDCFVGIGKTALIATVSPTDDCVPCSLNTLNYANRVRQMTLRNRARTNPIRLTFEDPVIETPENPSIEQDSEQNTIATAEQKESIQPRPTNRPQTSKKQEISIPIKKEKDKKPAIKAPEKEKKHEPKALERDKKQELKALEKEKKHVPEVNKGGDKARIPALFHPSKIQMASTPIKKSVSRVKVLQADPSQSSTPIKSAPSRGLQLKADDLFDHDTPIKGHKLKLLPENLASSEMQERCDNLVEKYLSRAADERAKSKIQEQPVVSEAEPREIHGPDTRKMKNFQQHMLFGKEEPMLESRSELSMNTNRPRIESGENSDDSLLLLRQKQRQLLQSRHKLILDQSKTTSQPDTDVTLTPSRGSKRQLQSYVQSLESKLESLRAEMDSSFHAASRHIDNASNKNRNEEAKQSEENNSATMLKEFLQRRGHLERQQQRFEAKHKALKPNPKHSHDEHEQRFLNDNSQFLSSDDENCKPDPLDRSLHKTDSPNLFTAHYKFLPVESEPLAKLQPATTILNPKALRPSNSSLESSTLSAKNTKTSRSSQNTSLNSNDLVCPKASGVTIGRGCLWNEPAKSDKPNKAHLELDTSVIDENSSCNNNKKKVHGKLVEAHEHQLSDITETCRKEMNLLSSLKDSQMDYGEYLNQLESMLSRKAHSIRDLQSQITQLKGYHYEGHSRPFPS